MELFHVHTVRVAGTMIWWRDRATQILLLLIGLRFVAGVLLPLSADEAYYWLWSQHLAAGYYDHPPAIAFIIRAGTLLFGDTPLGVRLGGLVLSLAATWFVWRSGILLWKDEKAAILAALFFNATLMIAVETMAATPDAPSIAFAAAFLFCLVKVQDTANGRWWLAAGMAAGLGLLSKYSALLLGAGAWFWLLANPLQRRWLWSAYPYLGGVIAAGLFAPNIVWNATHDWQTFAFQFGRITQGGWTLKYLFEFIGAQALLATPFIFLLGCLGLARKRSDAVFLAAALCWPSVLYFLWHTLHDRVQGNWPCFLFPAFALLAVAATREDWSGWTRKATAFSHKGALPVALALLAIAYAQALFHVIPLGRNDPLARLLAVDMDGVTSEIRKAKAQAGAEALVTSDYASTGWLRFYMPDQAVIVANEAFRWPDAPAPDPQMLRQPLLYVVESRLDRRAELARAFSEVKLISVFTRNAHGAPVAQYRTYRLSGWNGTALGRLP